MPVDGCDDRPQDIDFAVARTARVWGSYGERPPFVVGPREAVHDNSTEFMFVTKGRGYVSLDGKWVASSPHRCIVIPAGCVHSSHTLAEHEIGVCLHIATDVTLPLEEELGAIRHRQPQVAPKDKNVLASFERIFQAIVSENSANLEEECDEMLRRLFSLQDRSVSAKGNRKRLERVVDAMQADLAADHDLDALAAIAGLSRFRFSHIFRDHFGVGPSAYQQHLRLEEARTQLKESAAPVSVIAHAVGFHSPSRFAEVFKRTYGVTPLQYRAR